MIEMSGWDSCTDYNVNWLKILWQSRLIRVSVQTIADELKKKNTKEVLSGFQWKIHDFKPVRQQNWKSLVMAISTARSHMLKCYRIVTQDLDLVYFYHNMEWRIRFLFSCHWDWYAKHLFPTSLDRFFWAPGMAGLAGSLIPFPSCCKGIMGFIHESTHFTIVVCNMLECLQYARD